MSQKFPITISSWTLGDQCTFEERVAAAKAAGFVKLIRDKGVRPAVVGVEVISDEILSRGVAQAAKDNYEAARAVLEETWPEVLEK